MNTTYIWKITALDCKPTVDSLTNYVVTAHYRCVGSNDNYSGSVYSTVSFPVDADKPDYIPFEQLTEEQIVSWVKAALGDSTVSTIESDIAKQIQDQINPPIIHPPLPWSA